MDGLSTFFTGLRIIGEVSKWSEKALADGKVTIVEAIDLAERIGSVLGIKLELTIPGVAPIIPSEETEKEKEEADREKRTWEN